MAQAIDFITDALTEIGYLGAETPLESTDTSRAFTVFNDMLAEWGESGVLPGAAPVASLTTGIRVSRGTYSAIKLNLAGRCAPSFRRPISSTLSAAITASSESLLRMTTKIGRVRLPNTLPKGSGNYCNGDWFDNTFFSDLGEANF